MNKIIVISWNSGNSESAKSKLDKVKQTTIDSFITSDKKQSKKSNFVKENTPRRMALKKKIIKNSAKKVTEKLELEKNV